MKVVVSQVGKSRASLSSCTCLLIRMDARQVHQAKILSVLSSIGCSKDDPDAYFRDLVEKQPILQISYTLFE